MRIDSYPFVLTYYIAFQRTIMYPRYTLSSALNLSGGGVVKLRHLPAGGFLETSPSDASLARLMTKRYFL